MSLPIPYYYIVKHAPGIYARVAVNDIPFYRRAVDCNLAPAGPFNHLIVPGDNVVTMELFEVGEPTPTIIRSFSMEILREKDDVACFREKWPDFGKEYPEEERKLPIVHTRGFKSEGEVPKPIWWEAPRESFGAGGTSEQLDVVREVHEAYGKADVDAFLAAYELKFAEHRRYYGVVPELTPAMARPKYAGLLAMPWDLEPLDPEQLVFERRAEGRVAYVTRKDGTAALQARHKTDPSHTWEADLLMTRVDGRWRIFW